MISSFYQLLHGHIQTDKTENDTLLRRFADTQRNYYVSSCRLAENCLYKLLYITRKFDPLWHETTLQLQGAFIDFIL